jgi:ribonuclease P protein component
MVSGCGWLLNGDAKFLAVDAKKGESGSQSNCRPNTQARKSFGFPRSRRLTREADLELVRRTGKRMQTEHLEARASASLLLHPRIGVVVPKYKQRIVDRNRIKRRLRELARIRLLPMLGNIDVLVRAKPTAYDSTFGQLALEIDEVARWAKKGFLA